MEKSAGIVFRDYGYELIKVLDEHDKAVYIIHSADPATLRPRLTLAELAALAAELLFHAHAELARRLKK